ncbi:MAG: FKBP-type peptidyl-prolyl cis-trans isomerase [FCB group bacterium]
MFNRIVLSIILCVFVCSFEACSTDSKKPEFKSRLDSISYIIGANFGKNLKTNASKDSINLSLELMIAGFKEGFEKDTSMISDELAKRAMMAFQQEMMAKQQAKTKASGEKNKKEGDAVLEKNKTKPGVKVTASGLQYEVIKEGTGKKPKPEDEVTVNYHGTLLSGKVFDSSVDRKEPATFKLTQVIKGWTEGLQLMKEGAKYKFYVPAELAYGEQAPPEIGPNAVLTFEVELIKVNDNPPDAPAVHEMKVGK